MVAYFVTMIIRQEKRPGSTTCMSLRIPISPWTGGIGLIQPNPCVPPMIAQGAAISNAEGLVYDLCHVVGDRIHCSVDTWDS